jgi:hypothetical protein
LLSASSLSGAEATLVVATLGFEGSAERPVERPVERPAASFVEVMESEPDTVSLG